ATIHLLRGEERRARYVWSDDPLREWTAYLQSHGLRGDAAHGVTEAAQALRKVVQLPERFASLDDGAVVQAGDRRLRVVWTPGHSDYHYVLVDDERRAIFSGDHLLPTITPNVGLYPECRPNPLDDYLSSFEKFAAMGDYLVYPSHGEPYNALGRRIEALRAHHDERLGGVWERTAASDRAGASAADIVTHFWGDRLNAHETRFALVEVVAHLEYLRLAGDLDVAHVDGIHRYRVIRARSHASGGAVDL
ncbi:MAG TPA: MBL fold metallo-hydrolase, partial [Candidatus Eremiobacteraceae bacterium]|nr:MBL fold metallo-hydrolase [Candidatus Eremiobacteraceae bacterium]